MMGDGECTLQMKRRNLHSKMSEVLEEMALLKPSETDITGLRDTECVVSSQ
jgi:hypothetical protein